MKIIFLINSAFPYYAGGIETWLYNLTKILCNNHEVVIIAKDDKQYPMFFNDISDKIKFYRFKSLVSYRPLRIFVRSYINVIDLLIGMYSMSKVLKKVIKGKDVYYVIALDTMFNVIAGILAKKMNHNIKLIASSRGPHAEIYSKSFPLFEKMFFTLERKALNNADSIWANGYDTIELLKKKGFSSLLMRNGINYKRFDTANQNNGNFEKEILTDNIKIISVGTLLPIKGIYELIEAISVLDIKNIKNIEVFFIGKGDSKIYIDYARSLSISNRIHFLGHKDNVEEYMKKGDIITCLSSGGGMSMVAIESMASKTPIIAWDSPIYQQFNNEKATMLLVRLNDSYALAEGIMEVVNNRNKYRMIAQNANDVARNYDWSNIAKEFIENLGKVVV